MQSLKSEINRKLLFCWQSLPGASGGLPARSDYSPTDIPPVVLPHVFLCQITPDPFQVLIRLQGTYLAERAGQKYSGRLIDAATFGDNYQAILEVYRLVWQEQTPLVTEQRIQSPDGQTVITEVLHLPLAGNGAEKEVAFVTGSLDIIGGNSRSWTNFTAQSWSVLRSELLKPQTT